MPKGYSARNQSGWKHTAESKKKVSETSIIRKSHAKEKNGRWRNRQFPKCLECGKTLGNYKAKLCNRHKANGDKAYQWKGGITPLIKRIRHCFEYRQWRSDIFTRDDYTCQHCNKRGGDLEAHHIKQFSKIIEDNNVDTMEKALSCDELWNINNGLTLCKECHNKTK